ncbi:MAG: NAD-dependent epimerase/dehydratase family protein [Candidatus Pacebacteria bacterium]|nr:NAD-dependent epimerase/dehydratase family protein [Candidatus Paceibacterota bacterium]MCF7856903.1 NAD-dependent epimerase/dehydratase family protein [Candidatus Paceibacterota bacterium]
MQNVFIVGGAGYVGEMLSHQLSLRDDVGTIVLLDKEPQSDFSKTLPKVVYVETNMADDGWQEQVAKYRVDVVIHTAWQIRAMYGNPKEQWRWNVEGSEKVFDFAFNQESVKKLIYFSTASSYGARVDNTVDHYFTEAEGFRDDDYIYAEEKKVTEENLEKKYKEAKKIGHRVPQIFIVRPAAITGPRGRYMRIRFGLQSALQGNLKGGFIYKIVTLLTTFVPATKGWVRQFIHEDDVSDIVIMFTTEHFDFEYDAFNITPLGAPVFASDMAEAVGKKILLIYPWMARIAFWFFWHATRGKVPTCPGSWRFYSYPVVMSGEKLAQIYTCKHSSKDAFRYTAGRYEESVPESLRVIK